MATAHCASCGKKSRLTYPKYDPICCTQRCAAQYLLVLVEVGYGYCADCGELDCQGECTTLTHHWAGCSTGGCTVK